MRSNNHEPLFPDTPTLGARYPSNGDNKSALRRTSFKDSGVAMEPEAVPSSTKLTFSELQSINVARKNLHTSYSS